jgi:hypothetical protein
MTTKYRGYTIEYYPANASGPAFYLIHTGGMYGYYALYTLEDAKTKIDRWKD